MKRFLQNEDGFTIQEILVVLIVGSILVSMSFALFQFTNELFQMWYGSTELKNDVNRILHVIAADIQRSNAIIEQTESGVVLSKGSGRQVRYSYSNQVLKRDNDDLTPKSTKSFLVRWENVADRKGLLPMIRVKIAVQSRWTSYESEIVCSIIPSSKSEFNSSK
jgi:Tfp pilus assembly protein FimT